MQALKRISLTLALVFLATTARAEDIEIYLDPQSDDTSEPMVMFSLDYRPNLGSATDDHTDFFANLLDQGVNDPDLPDGNWTFFDVLRLSIKVVFQDLSGVKVGLMLNHDRINNCAGPANSAPKSNSSKNCSNGGYIAMGLESLEADDGNGAKAKFQDILSSIPVPQGNLAHPHQGKELFFEYFRYMTGQGVYNGRNGYTDYAGDPALNLDDEFPGAAWDEGIISGSGTDWTYASPLTASGSECTRLFTVNFMFFVTNQEDDSDDAITQSRANGGMGGIDLQGANNSFATVVEYLYDADLADGTFGGLGEIDGKQNVVSYFIVDPSFINQTTTSYAQAGGTDVPLPLSEDPQELIDTLNNIFQQILSVSTTFVAASVPVNVFNRAEIVDNVYIALFQADPDAKPRWPGNLKKLKIDEQEGAVRLVDQLDNDAVAPDGRINFNALTFWTDGAALPAPDPDQNEVAGRDGRSVTRGGAGQNIPGYLGAGPGAANGVGNRILYTEPGSFNNGDETDFLALNDNSDVAASIQNEFDSGNVPSIAAMIRWMRGMDEFDEDGDGDLTEARAWILGDPLHSRPLPINYGALGDHDADNPDIRILMGSNDGYMRMVRNTDSNGNDLGQEVWGFMPREVMDKMHLLEDNTPLGGSSPHPYTVDGAPVVYTEDLAQDGTLDHTVGDRVLVFFGLRRGGNAYYGLDVSDPDDPHLLWRITKGGDFGELGQTFSTPQVGNIVLNGEDTPVLVFGGGYDTNKDARGGVGTADSEGNAIYVVNANDGSLIWKAVQGSGTPTSTVYPHTDMLDSFPSDPTIVDTNGDGSTDRVYIGDTGGTVWRVDMAGPTDDWTASVIAYTGRQYDGSTTLHDRRFFHAPDVVLARDNEGSFDAVIIGSGNRANPLDRLQDPVTENYTYMIKDRRTSSGPVPDDHVAYDHDSFGDVTDNCLQLDTCEDSPPDLTDGWRLGLFEALGEKSLAVPFTVAGTIFFTTYLPPSDTETTTCGPSEGGGILYAVSLADASSTINFDTTDDDPDRPGEPTTTADRTRELRSGGIPAEVVSLPPGRILLPDLSTETVPGSMRWRTFWFENEDPNG